MQDKVDCKKLEAFLKDEKAATKEYRDVGFDNLSKDEARHARFMKDKQAEMGCKIKPLDV